MGVLLALSTLSIISYQNPWLFPPLTPHFPSVIVLNVRRTRKEMSRQNNKCKAQEENNMCRKLVVTNEIFLGARPICYEAYSLPKGEVVELTEKQIKDVLKGLTTDEVYGLALSETGELILDTENFFATNMMKKVHANTLMIEHGAGKREH